VDIGIIGSGHIGGTLVRDLTRLGHRVAVANSRGPASLAALAAETRPRAPGLGAAPWAAGGRLDDQPSGTSPDAGRGVAQLGRAPNQPDVRGRVGKAPSGARPRPASSCRAGRSRAARDPLLGCAWERAAAGGSRPLRPPHRLTPAPPCPSRPPPSPLHRARCRTLHRTPPTMCRPPSRTSSGGRVTWTRSARCWGAHGWSRSRAPAGSGRRASRARAPPRWRARRTTTSPTACGGSSSPRSPPGPT